MQKQALERLQTQGAAVVQTARALVLSRQQSSIRPGLQPKNCSAGLSSLIQSHRKGALELLRNHQQQATTVTQSLFHERPKSSFIQPFFRHFLIAASSDDDAMYTPCTGFSQKRPSVLMAAFVLSV